MRPRSLCISLLTVAASFLIAPTSEQAVSVDWIRPEQSCNGLTLVVPSVGHEILWVAMDGSISKRLELPWTILYAEQLAGGRLLVLSKDGVREVTEDGQVAWHYKPKMAFAHHDMLRSRADTTFILTQAPDRKSGLLLDSVLEVDRNGTLVWSWNAVNHFDPRTDLPAFDKKLGRARDWLHINSIDEFPDRDLLLSVRNLNRLIRVDYSSGEIIWSWGGDVLSMQHSAKLLPSGNILLFDNQNRDGRCVRMPCTSRALEIDPERGRIVWKYESTGLYSPGFGDADRLDNGNTLITYGQRHPRALILEVSPAGEILWRLESRMRRKHGGIFDDREKAWLYRAQRTSCREDG